MKRTGFFASILALVTIAIFFGFKQIQSTTPTGPKLEVRIDNLETATPTQAQLVSSNQIEAFVKATPDTKAVSYNVKNYTIAISPKKGMAYMEEVTGNKITSHTKARLANLNEGDLVIVANVNTVSQINSYIYVCIYAKLSDIRLHLYT